MCTLYKRLLLLVEAAFLAPPDALIYNPTLALYFLASPLYYPGVLTLAGRDAQGRLRLTIPNLVVRSLYAERLYDALVPEYEDRETRRAVADRFYAYADPEPLCDFIEQRFFKVKVFENRDLRWSNELTIKTAFLTLLFNDTLYIMDSETAIDRGHSDLSLILRPDMRKYNRRDLPPTLAGRTVLQVDRAASQDQVLLWTVCQCRKDPDLDCHQYLPVDRFLNRTLVREDLN